MFFNVEILCMQRHGKFAKVWIAATRGTDALGKKEILELNLEDMSQEISKYITSESAQPKKRFSLVLSSKLIFGLARLYHRKTTIYLDEVAHFLCKIRKPLALTLPESSIKKEKTPKVGRKKPESGTPDIAVKITPTEVTDDVLKTMFSQHQGHDEYITIREEVSTIQPNLQDDVFNLGSAADVEAVERALNGAVAVAVEPSIFPLTQLEQPSPARIQVKADVHPTPSSPKRSRGESDEKIKKRRFTRSAAKETSDLEQIEVVVEPKGKIAVSKQDEVSKGKLQEQGNIQLEGEQIAIVEKTVVPEKESIRKPKTPLSPNKGLIREQVYNPSTLLRNYSDEKLLNKRGEIDQYSFSLFRIKISDQQNNYLLQTIESIYVNEKVDDIVAELARGSKSRDSLAVSINSLRARVSEQSTKDIPHETEIRTPVEIQEAIASLQEGMRITAIQEEGLLPVELITGEKELVGGISAIIEETLIPATFMNGEKEAVVDVPENKKVPKGKLGKESTTEAIKDILRKWNWNEKFPTIVDVCPMPINRLNVSRTFTTLLELNKQQYVVLVENLDTMELDHMEMGQYFK